MEMAEKETKTPKKSQKGSKNIIFDSTKSKESKIGVIAFTISGNIKNFYDNVSINYLEKIGAQGLSNKFKLLIEEKFER